MRAQSTSYRDRLNAVLAYEQMEGDYLGGFRVTVSENGHLIHINDANNEEKRGGRTGLRALLAMKLKMLFSDRAFVARSVKCLLPVKFAAFDLMLNFPFLSYSF